jgi:general secretion pathway protein F
MPAFEYIARSSAGQRVAGVLSGASEAAVLAELETRQLVPVSIAERAESSGGARGLLSRRTRKVSSRTLATAYLQLSDLLRAGVPLLRALRLLGNRKARGGTARVSAVFKELAESVAQGEDLAAAMQEASGQERGGGVFPRVHIAMVRAGEKGGFLEQVFARLGQFVMGQAELRGKILGNLIYPMVLVGFGLVVLTVIFGIFVPKFRPMYANIPPADMPSVSKLVFAGGTLVSRYGIVTIVVLALLGAALWRVLRVPAVRRKIAEARTFLPVIGPLTRAIAAARFCRMLGTMLGNGIPVLTSMQIAKEAAGNPLMEEAVDAATDAVRAGQTLAPPLLESGLFSEDVVEMIAVAEAANNLDEVLVTIAATIETRVDRMLTTAVRLVEPLLLLCIALVVAVVAAGLILPMTKMKAGF